MPNSTNLGLPYIDANQNQKYVTHNTALRILDALIQIQVQSAALTTPPASPADGQVWIVGSGATGAWTGKDLQLAAWQDGAWAFYAPKAGYIAYNVAAATALVWNGTSWSGLAGAFTAQQLSALGIGTAPDSANPLSVLANAALFAARTTAAGGTGDMRLKLNKQAAANTASFLFQDAFSGRAEIGLTGDDSFHFKVSADGTTFLDALVLDAIGRAAFPQSGTPEAPQGRLTLASGTAAMASAVNAAGTVFYTPYLGNSIPLWNGSVFVPTSFGEVGQALSDAAKSPAAAAAGNIYDMFGWLDGTTFRVTRGPAWTAGATGGSATARGSGAGSTALVRTSGILVNQYAVTNGPAAGYGTYLGTIATDAGAATVTFNLGSAAAGGGAAVVGVWNMYNRVLAVPNVMDANANHTYATPSFRPYDNSTGTRITFVSGLAEDSIYTQIQATAANSSGGSVQIAIGLDSTTSAYNVLSYSTATATQNMPSFTSIAPQLGRHYLQALENASAGVAVTFYDSGSFGLACILRC